MGLLTPGRRVRPKRFDYEPRFYDPKKEEKLKKRMRVKRLSTAKRRSPGHDLFRAVVRHGGLRLYPIGRLTLPF